MTWEGNRYGHRMGPIADQCRGKGISTHPACGSPACFSGFKKYDSLTPSSDVLGQVSSSRRARYTTTYDDDVRFGRELFGGTVSEQEIIRLAVPERVGRGRRWKRRAFVLHGVAAGGS